MKKKILTLGLSALMALSMGTIIFASPSKTITNTTGTYASTRASKTAVYRCTGNGVRLYADRNDKRSEVVLGHANRGDYFYYTGRSDQWTVRVRFSNGTYAWIDRSYVTLEWIVL